MGIRGSDTRDGVIEFGYLAPGSGRDWPQRLVGIAMSTDALTDLYNHLGRKL